MLQLTLLIAARVTVLTIPPPPLLLLLLLLLRLPQTISTSRMPHFSRTLNNSFQRSRTSFTPFSDH